MMRVHYADLIGLPYADRTDGPYTFDCVGLVLEVFRRAGWSTGSVPTMENVYARVADLNADVSDHPWEQVAAPGGAPITRRLDFGDVVMVLGDTRPHVSVVVDAPAQLAISIAENAGVYACAVSRLTRATAVYRLQEALR